MIFGHAAGSSGPQHDSATRRLDEARGRQQRLVDRLALTRDQTCAKERLSAGRAGVAARDQWLHWIDEGESLEPWADGDWAPVATAGEGRVGLRGAVRPSGALVELVRVTDGDGPAALAASWIATATPACVGPLRKRLVAFAAPRTGSAELLGDLRLAATEAITNAVLHAYRDRDEPGTVTAGIAIARGRVEVVVSDGGVGPSPRPDSPGAGLGTSLMAAVCDGITIGPGAGGRGTEVRMVFALR
jgi:anti-sigma regulatory factor (Ser/Thr protein kinase)